MSAETNKALVEHLDAILNTGALGQLGRPATGGERKRLGRLPEAQIEEWPGDGHFVHLVDPGRFATSLRTFTEHCDQAG